MASGTVALLGNLNIDRGVFDRIAKEFDWDVETTATIRSLREMSDSRNVVAVLFSARTLGISWNQALESVLGASPRALPVVCPGFSESIRWPELSDAGAFHELRLPIEEGEVRRSLGFIWAAKRGDLEGTRVAPQKATRGETRESKVSRFAARH